MKKTRTRYFIRRLQAGVSLLEVMLSLSVIAIILVMATRYYFTASENERVNQARAEIGTILSAITSWKTNHALFDGSFTLQALLDQKLLPVTTDIEGGVIYSPWAQPITLTVTNQNVKLATSAPTEAICNYLKTGFPNATAKCNGEKFSVCFFDTGTDC